MSKKIRVGVWVISIIFVLFIGTGLFIGNFFYDLALNPEVDKSQVLNAPQNEMKDPVGIDLSKVRADGMKWLESTKEEDVYIRSNDDLKLRAIRIENPKSNDWVVLVHGYLGRGEDMAARALEFYNQGYNVLMPDLRGHGESEGAYIGMGWDDRLDIISWIDYLDSKDNYPNIILYGVSMGAATVMMTSGEDLPKNVKAVIEDCGYSSINDEFAYQLKTMFGVPQFPLMNFANTVTKIRAGYSFKEGSSVKQVEKSKTPTLFIHGDSDTFVPFYMEDEVYKAHNGEKEKLVIQGAGHGEAAYVDSETYWNTIFDFINKYK